MAERASDPPIPSGRASRACTSVRRHEFSTFRRTLGAVQAQWQNSATVDEEALTEWMMAHLRVLAAPYEDADTLGRLETGVLALLDPPLNLQGRPVTPLRRRLTELRRVVSKKAATT